MSSGRHSPWVGVRRAIPSQGYWGLICLLFQTYEMEFILKLNDNTVSIHGYQKSVFYNVYLCHTLWFTNQLFQYVSIETTHVYCRVTMKHVNHSYGQALIYIHKWHEAGNRWVHVHWKYIKVWDLQINLHYFHSLYMTL